MTADYELFKKYKETGDKKIRDELVCRYTYMAKILARKFGNCSVEYEDIYQVACMGVVLALERFDPDRGVQFATFATPTVLGEIRRFLRDKAKCIKIPRRLYEIFCRAENIKRQSENITHEELAELLNMPLETIDEAYKAGDAAFIKSLEDEAYADGGLGLSSMISVDEEGYTLIENEDFMRYCLSKLSEKERQLFILRFQDGRSQRDTASVMGVSQMYVSRLEHKIIDKFKAIYQNNYETT